MNLIFENVTIETTRKCNLTCKHCMRGDAQNLDINYKYIDLLLRKNHIFFLLYFSGGEPLLNKKAIIYIINKIIKENLPVFSIGLTTNATIYEKEVIDALLKYTKHSLEHFPKIYNKENSHLKPVTIRFSNDQFHQFNPEIIEKYQENKQIKFKKTGTLDILEDEVLLTGKAKGNIPFGQYFEFKNKELEIKLIQKNTYYFLTPLYITAKGNITTQGNGSYIDMDTNNLGNLEENTFNHFIKNQITKPKIKNKIHQKNT